MFKRKTHEEYVQKQLETCIFECDKYNIKTVNEFFSYNEPLFMLYLYYERLHENDEFIKLGDEMYTPKQLRKYFIAYIKHKCPEKVSFAIEDELYKLGKEVLDIYKQAVKELTEFNKKKKSNIKKED